ncbi:MAG: exo-alpha-sialidase [Ruminococcaceae bacterium]|nr:exo-alpha-sialidase [Oscillospiraceae bacterium]
MNILKTKAKSVMAILLCLSLIFGEAVIFTMNSKAEAILQGDPLLDISVGEEFIIEDGETEIRQFPFVHGFGDDVIVSFSQFTDTEWGIHENNGLRVSHDGGATWPTYIEESDLYFTSVVKLNSGALLGINYTSYWIDQRHSSVEYATSTDNGETWEKHTGTVEFPQNLKITNTGWSSFQFHRGMMVMPDGSIQGLMYGAYEGDSDYRTIWVKSTDDGENWSVVSTVAAPTGITTEPTTFCEPTVARCSDGSLLCVMRIGNAPLYQCRSTDNGLTWSKPEQLPGVTDTDAYSVDAYLYMMSNGVLVLSYGRPNCKMLFSPDGTGREWKYLTPTYTDTTSGYTGVCEVSPGKLLLVGDKGADWQSPENPAIWGKYVYVNKTNVCLEEGVDAGYVEINGNSYTAVPYEGNEFSGWYNEDSELVSNNLTETFTDGLFTAKFEDNSIFESPGFEYSDLGLVSTKEPANAVYPNWYASADWAKVNVVTSEGFNSNKSLEFFTHYRNDCYTDIVGLKPNTNYTVSYSWMMRNGYTTENNNCFYGMIASSTAYGTTGEAYQNRLGGTYGSYSPEAGVWQKHTFTFNTGDLTSVRIFLEYSSHPQAVSNLFIDNFTIAKEPEPLSVNLESGTDAGYLTNEGNTYTAVPYDGNKFLGWYSGDALISKNLTETFSDNDGAITAKFKNNSIFASPGYETATTGDVHYYDHSETAEGWHVGPSWGKVMIIKTEGGHSGSNYLAIMARYQNNTYTNLNRLKPNTDYTVSYYWKMEQGYSETSGNIYYGMIASGTNCLTSGEAWGQKLGHAYGAQYPEANTWKKETFTFNTGDLTSVRLFLDYESTLGSGYIYIDEFTVFETPEPLTVSVESGADAGYITNEGTVYTANPYDGNEFLGWYNAEGAISTEATYDFAEVEGAVTAKFKNNSVFASPGYELLEVGDVVYREHSTDAEGWHIGADWGSAKIINSISHIGTKSLALFSRYQSDVYTNVVGLKPNTNYTVSYYWMMQETYTAANNNNFYGMVASSTEHDSIGSAYQNTIGNSYGNNYAEGGVWQKDAFTFNTGDLTSVRLFVEYSSANTTLYIDDLTVFETPEGLLDYDADTNSNKIVNNGGAANITEVGTTLSDLEILGDKVYSLNTSADFAVGYSADAMLLKGGKRYDLSLYLKVADNHTMLTANDAGQYITFYMKSDNDDNNRIALTSAYTMTIEKTDGKRIIFDSQSNEFSVDKTHVSNESGNAIWVKITASFTPSANTMATLAIRPNAAGTVYMDRIKVTSAEDAVDEIQSALTTVGTAIRTNGIQALRFKSAITKSAISKSYFDTYELVEYGSVAIKTEYLGGKELALGDYVQSDGKVRSARKGAAYIKGECNIIFDETDSEIQFTAALTEISEKNYNTSYSVRTYAVLQRPDGTTFTVYDDNTLTATVYEIANLAYNAEGNNNGYAETQEVREYLYNNIISKADFSAFPNDGFKS